MTKIPAVVKSAAEAYRRSQDPKLVRSLSDSATRRVARGDLRIVEPPVREAAAGTRRLCFVVGVDPAADVAEVVLVHSTPELATSVDGVVPSCTTGAPYDAVVQTDLRGVAWTFQLGRLVGRLDEGSLEALSSIALGNRATERAQGNEIWSGSALTGAGDGRWTFKTDEGSALRSLTRECTAALLDGGTDATVLVEEKLHSGTTRHLPNSTVVTASGGLPEVGFID